MTRTAAPGPRATAAAVAAQRALPAGAAAVAGAWLAGWAGAPLPLAAVAGGLLAAVAAAAAGLRRERALQSALDEARADTERLALTDALTGCCSRRQFFVFAEGELARSRRAQVPLSVLVVDIDRLRAHNDHAGHDAGDAALQRVAAACRADLREYDTLARHGGDSFAVLLPQTATDTAVTIGERMRTAVADAGRRAGPATGGAPALTVSVGVATAAPAPDNIDALMARAEQALARAQQAGGNRVTGPAPA